VQTESSPDLGGPIVPVLIGDDRVAVEVAEAVQARGYDVRALRPPTVPRGGALLRISVHANHTDRQIDGVCEAIATSLAGVRTEAAGDP
jgi:8-amino-7-oxononanoate synthase